MRTSCILPSDVESPHRDLEVLGVVGAIDICGVLSSRVFISASLMSNMVFIAFYELTIIVIDSSKDSCTDVAMPS